MEPQSMTKTVLEKTTHLNKTVKKLQSWIQHLLFPHKPKKQIAITRINDQTAAKVTWTQKQAYNFFFLNKIK